MLPLKAHKIDIRSATRNNIAVIEKGGYVTPQMKKEETKKTRIHLWWKDGDMRENDLLYAREYRQELEELIARDVGVTGRVKFSRKAGCSCGCSPGFIAEEDIGRTIFVDVSSGFEKGKPQLKVVK